MRYYYYHAGGQVIIIILLFTWYLNAAYLIIKFIIETVIKMSKFRLAKTLALFERKAL